LKSFFTGLFAKIHIDGNLPAEHGLQSTGNIAQKASRTDCDTADNTQVPNDAKSLQLNAGGDHGWVYHIKGFVMKLHFYSIIFTQKSENVTGGIYPSAGGFCKGKIGCQEFY
jgi:hypothetical protein